MNLYQRNPKETKKLNLKKYENTFANTFCILPLRKMRSRELRLIHEKLIRIKAKLPLNRYGLFSLGRPFKSKILIKS